MMGLYIAQILGKVLGGLESVFTQTMRVWNIFCNLYKNNTARMSKRELGWYKTQLEEAQSRADFTLASVILYRILEKQATDLLNIHFPFTDWTHSPYSQIKNQIMVRKQVLFPASSVHLPFKPGLTDKLLAISIFWPDSIQIQLIEKVVEHAETRHRAWLVHGDVMVTKKAYEAMQNVFTEILVCIEAIGEVGQEYNKTNEGISWS
ncbi:MAG: hypothetical protein U9Q77_07790 [Candidatus Marinimicrobia bacterium]|nr:hypothetical protein [Candidatus Neomarinimicrobiota bacterium]